MFDPDALLYYPFTFEYLTQKVLSELDERFLFRTLKQELDDRIKIYCYLESVLQHSSFCCSTPFFTLLRRYYMHPNEHINLRIHFVYETFEQSQRRFRKETTFRQASPEGARTGMDPLF